ncbi:hypothetical protein KC330_g149 [Hortaea werneckii]|nr:hypothetical protein KC330_g149 [Hortaea werneckii]
MYGRCDPRTGSKVASAAAIESKYTSGLGNWSMRLTARDAPTTDASEASSSAKGSAPSPPAPWPCMLTARPLPRLTACSPVTSHLVSTCPLVASDSVAKRARSFSGAAPAFSVISPSCQYIRLRSRENEPCGFDWQLIESRVERVVDDDTGLVRLNPESRLDKLIEYSPSFSGTCVMNAGFGATFSRLENPLDGRPEQSHRLMELVARDSGRKWLVEDENGEKAAPAAAPPTAPSPAPAAAGANAPDGDGESAGAVPGLVGWDVGCVAKGEVGDLVGSGTVSSAGGMNVLGTLLTGRPLRPRTVLLLPTVHHGYSHCTSRSPAGVSITSLPLRSGDRGRSRVDESSGASRVEFFDLPSLFPNDPPNGEAFGFRSGDSDIGSSCAGALSFPRLPFRTVPMRFKNLLLRLSSGIDSERWLSSSAGAAVGVCKPEGALSTVLCPALCSCHKIHLMRLDLGQSIPQQVQPRLVHSL